MTLSFPTRRSCDPIVIFRPRSDVDDRRAHLAGTDHQLVGGGVAHAGIDVQVAIRDVGAAVQFKIGAPHLFVHVAGCAAGHSSEEHTSELQSLMRTSYAVSLLKNNKSVLYFT